MSFLPKSPFPSSIAFGVITWYHLLHLLGVHFEAVLHDSVVLYRQYRIFPYYMNAGEWLFSYASWIDEPIVRTSNNCVICFFHSSKLEISIGYTLDNIAQKEYFDRVVYGWVRNVSFFGQQRYVFVEFTWSLSAWPSWIKKTTTMLNKPTLAYFQ